MSYFFCAFVTSLFRSRMGVSYFTVFANWWLHFPLNILRYRETKLVWPRQGLAIRKLRRIWHAASVVSQRSWEMDCLFGRRAVSFRRRFWWFKSLFSSKNRAFFFPHVLTKIFAFSQQLEVPSSRTHAQKQFFSFQLNWFSGFLRHKFGFQLLYLLRV